MAGSSQQGVHVVKLRPLCVPTSLTIYDNNAKFVKWDELSSSATLVTLHVDPKGHVLFWKDQNKDVDGIEISNIRDTRTGKYAKVPKDPKLREACNMGTLDVPLEDKTVTVVYGADYVNQEFINFVSNSAETAQFWSTELFKMAHNLLANNSNAMHYIERAHTKLCTLASTDGRVHVKNIVRMIAQNKDDRKRVEKALEQAGLPAGKNDSIAIEKFTFEAFFRFYKHLTGRVEMHQIFREIGAVKKPYLTKPQLVEFLNNEQRDPRLNEILYPYFDNKRAQEIIEKYEPDKSLIAEGHLSQEGLLRYLMSDDNIIIAKEVLDQSDDLNQPLSHYFINSSHNTYLTGHQLTGKSSVEIYRQVLLSGCRCVELDCWEREEEPIITHGFTMCTEILFREVVEAINESAFKSSDLPLILSFENHTTPKTQEKIARYCKEIFGERLLEEPIESHPIEHGIPLPSPQSLRGKVIIKNKKKKAARAPIVNRATLQHQDTASSSAPERKVSLAPLDTVITEENKMNGVVVTSEKESSEQPPVTEPVISTEDAIDDDDFEELDDTKKEEGTASQESEAGAELSALVNYFTPTHFRSFEISEKRNRSYEISSFVESQATSLLKEYPVEFVNYNKRQCSRIYPKGTRVDSSNYMPQVFWNAGCQFVALNYQTLDLGMQLNLGLFEYNGRTGFLLKPEFMRRKDRNFDPFCESTVDGIIAGHLTVKVISAQFLSEKRCGTFVEVDMYGLPCDTKRKQFRTRTVPNNAINPVYNEEPFVFKKVVLPDLACVRIAAYEDTGKLIGHRVIPVTGLRPGYKHVQLRNEANQPLLLPSSVFVYIKVKDYVPDAFADFADALANPIAYQSKIEKHAEQLKCLMDDDDDDDIEKQNTFGETVSVDESGKEEAPRVKKESKSSIGPADITSGNVNAMETDGNLKGTPKSAQKFPKGQANRLSSGVTGSPTQQHGSAYSRSESAPVSSTVSVSSVQKPSEDMDNGALFTEEAVASLVNQITLDKVKEDQKFLRLLQKQEKEICGFRKDYEKKIAEKRMSGRKLEEQLRQSFQKEKQALEKNHNRSLKKLSVSKMAAPDDHTKLKEEKNASLIELETDHQTRVKEHKKKISETMTNVIVDHHEFIKNVYLKHHEMQYTLLEKLTNESKEKQMKVLQTLHDSEVTAAAERSRIQTREEIKQLVKSCNDKAEISRRKREIQQKQINKGVTERQRLMEQFEKAKTRLEKVYESLKTELENDRDFAKLEIEKTCQTNCTQALAEYIENSEENGAAAIAVNIPDVESTDL